MKPELHPTWYPEAKAICACGEVWTIGATVPELHTDVCAKCHPFFTGEQRIVDTEGQVDRFMRRLQRREELRAAAEEESEKHDPSKLTVDSMSLGTRATNALLESEITTVGDVMELLEKGDDALLALPGIGQKALIDIKRFLRAENLI